MDTTARTSIAAAAFAVASIFLSSCGTDVEPPAQDIGGVTPEPSPRHFEPACNTRAAVTPCPDPDAWTGNEGHNRKRFDDELQPRR
jgi:hypothetical protein